MTDGATTTTAPPLRTSRRVPPPPPRLTGQAEVDLIGLREWNSQFYQISVIETGLLDPAYQSQGVTIDLDNLPDPTLTTIARAQATANAVFAALSPAVHQSGRFTISDADDEAVVTIDPPLPDDGYRVLLTVSTSTGGALIDAFTVIQVSRSRDAFAVVVAAAPGAGKTITYDYLVTAR